NKTVDKIHDPKEKRVTGVTLRCTETDTTRYLPVAWEFDAIGHKPNNELFAGQLDMDENVYLITNHNVRTNLHGVFACGDVQDHEYRQAVTAAGSGCMAAIEAERLLAAEDAETSAKRPDC